MSITYRVWVEGEADDGHDVTCGVPGPLPRDTMASPYGEAMSASDAAEVYADHIHSHHEGYEFTWPITFRLRSPDGTEEDFEVSRDFDPVFRASKVPS